MAINQLNKYVWLVETIHRARKRGGITLKEIQSRWLDSDISEGTELSRRTFINNQGRRIKLNFPSTAYLSSPHSIPLSVVLG